MKNYSEQIRQNVLTSAGNAETKHSTVDGYSDIKIQNAKIIDTSSSADAFSGQTAGDVIKMTGWANEENNRIFIITEVEGDGEWIKVDKELKDEAAPESAGATIYTGSENLTVTGASTDDVVVAAFLYNAAASAPTFESLDGFANMRVTAANTITSFCVADEDDQLFVTWADFSRG